MRLPQLNQILDALLASHEGVSDINVTVGKPFQVECSGELRPVVLEPAIRHLTAFQTETLALNLIRGDRRLTRIFLTEGSCDLSYALPGVARFRVNIFSQRGTISIVMRRLPSKIAGIADLRLPPAFLKMTEERNGIIFVTGATGTGKTTSLAAVLNEINETRSVHVVTLEDPVEFSHPHKKATFNQRELGKDFDAFASGLRAALRQAPKVILVGEIRDRETVEIALSAAETGHLVLSTLHTVDAGQTINRVLGMFSTEEERQVRARLAETIRWVASQRLLPKVGGGRVAAFELMQNNLRVKDVILNGESEGKTYYEIIETGKPFGMMTFDQCILDHYRSGLITEETAMSFASRKPVVGRGIDETKSQRGEKTTSIEGLSVDTDYGRDPKRTWM